MRAARRLRKQPLLEDGQTLELSGEKPLRAGNLRVIYNYPGDSSRLVKIFRNDVRPRWMTSYLPSLQNARRLYKHTVPLLRELSEWGRVKKTPGRNPHLQAVHGLVKTDLGLGMVVEAVRRKDGKLARTLREIILNGDYDAAMEARFEEFVDWFLASDIVAADIHCNNLVLDTRRDLFVLVDGSGDKTLIPLRSWFQRLNNRSKLGYIAELREEVAAHLTIAKPSAKSAQINQTS